MTPPALLLAALICCLPLAATSPSTAVGEHIPVNILLLLPTNDTYMFSMAKVLASLQLAISEIKTTDYGKKFAVKIIPDVCDCGGIRAPLNAMENIYKMRNNTEDFQAVFGPMCD
jgi:hypothetical protein